MKTLIMQNYDITIKGITIRIAQTGPFYQEKEEEQQIIFDNFETLYKFSKENICLRFSPSKTIFGKQKVVNIILGFSKIRIKEKTFQKKYAPIVLSIKQKEINDYSFHELSKLLPVKDFISFCKDNNLKIN